MRKFFSIVIPRYKETEKDIFPLLCSICTQVGVSFDDIEVIIVNDGTEKGLDENFIGIFGAGIRQVNLEKNRGPGAARQAGLDAAKGDYVMFCDADDSLHNVGTLNAFFQELEEYVPDMLVSSWLEEIADSNGDNKYITHECDNTWMHGKVFRKQFLMQHKIRFHEELRVHEDSYFLAIAASLSERSRYIPIVSYIWKYNSSSITRNNNGIYTYESIPEFIRACSLAYTEIEKYNPGLMEYKIIQFTLYNYFCLHQAGWQSPDHAEYLRSAEKAFAAYISPMWHYWEDAEQEVIANIYNEERKKSFMGYIETETIWSWINRLGLPA